MTVKLPAGVDWYIWRIRTSARLGHPSFREMDEDWTVSDLLDAHELLDAFEEAESRATT